MVGNALPNLSQLVSIAGMPPRRHKFYIDSSLWKRLIKERRQLYDLSEMEAFLLEGYTDFQYANALAVVEINMLLTLKTLNNVTLQAGETYYLYPTWNVINTINHNGQLYYGFNCPEFGGFIYLTYSMFPRMQPAAFTAFTVPVYDDD